MRKGLHAGVIALVGLAGCFAQTPDAQSGGKDKILAAPPAFAKRFYRAPGGQFYVPAGVPVKLSIGLATGGGGTDSADASDRSLGSALWDQPPSPSICGERAGDPTSGNTSSFILSTEVAKIPVVSSRGRGILELLRDGRSS